MGFRVRKSFKVAPGIRVNLSKSGMSTSIGPRGAKVNIGHGRTRTSIGIPGTGVYYTSQTSHKRRASGTRQVSALQLQRAIDRDRRAQARAARQVAREAQREYASRREAECLDMTEELTDRVEVLSDVLLDALSRQLTIDFESLKDRSDPPEIEVPTELQQATLAPRLEEFLPKPLGFLRKRFDSQRRKHERATTTAHAAYEEKSRAAQRAEEVRVAALSRLYSAHEVEVAEHDRQQSEQHYEVNEFREGFQAGRSEAVEQFFRMVLAASEYPEGFPCAFEVGHVPEFQCLHVEREFPPFDIVPDARGFRYVKTRDEISPLKRPESERKQMYGNLLCALAIRTVHEVFDADDEGVVQSVVFDGYVDGIDQATGQEVAAPLISVKATRVEFEALDLARIEPTACLKHLGAHVSRAPRELITVSPVSGCE